MRDVLTLAEARRLALAAQGFNRFRRVGEIDRAQIAKTIRRLNLLQVDSVNVLVRAHYMPLYSRLGFSARAAGWEPVRLPRRLFEYWAREASLLRPCRDQRLRRGERSESRARPHRPHDAEADISLIVFSVFMMLSRWERH